MLNRMSLAQAALLEERTPFAIDDAKDEDEDDEFGDEIDGEVTDDQVMDEVDAFLEAHDSGLTDADQQVAKGEFKQTRRPTRADTDRILCLDLLKAEPVK